MKPFERQQGVGVRAIVHLDLDCFYAQVEHRRLGLGQPPWTDALTPALAVQQWEGLIAINYTARAAGVKRGMRAAEARERCPDIVLVHVETLSAQDEDTTSAGPNRQTQKACLRRYREASDEVFSIFAKHAPRCERASIDEAYLDLTAEAGQWLTSLSKGDVDAAARLESLAAAATCAGGAYPDIHADDLLLAASVLVQHIRDEVYQETGFTVSAGIAENKMCAKLGSACHKPNRQTILPRGSIRPFMEALPICNLRGLGGKLGEELRKCTGLTTDAKCGELMRIPLTDLQRSLGEKDGAFIWRICQGIDTEEVKTNTLKPKQYLSFKSFQPPITSFEGLDPWIIGLSRELMERLQSDEGRRLPQSLVVHHRGSLHETETTKTSTRTSDFPPGTPKLDSMVALVKKILTDRLPRVFPCSRLAIGASDFREIQSGPTLATFFNSKATVPSLTIAGIESPDQVVCTDDEVLNVGLDENHHNLDNSSVSTDQHIAKLSTDAQQGDQQVKDEAGQVVNFHRMSRLHFLGTWRERFEQWCRAESEREEVHLVDPLVYETFQKELAEIPTSHSEDSSVGTRLWAHLDMDCFFVSVATRARADKTLPVAVVSSAGHTGELCSCNYAARALGVNTHLWYVGKALELVPTLELIPISEALLREVEATWQQVYQLLRLACGGKVEYIHMRSCDEAFLEVHCADPFLWAGAVRRAIFAQTNCTCSVGMGPSQVVAKLAGKACKPDGAKWIKCDAVKIFFADLPLDSLPQVGRVFMPKLEARGLHFCRDVMAKTRAQLVEWFGAKGELLWLWAHGEDSADDILPKQRKTMSAEINFGVRPRDQESAHDLLSQVARQLSERLCGLTLVASQLTLKVKIAVPGWVEPPHKRGGHGFCDDVSRSVAMPKASQNSDALFKVGRQLLDALAVEPTRIRGIGLAARVDQAPSDAKGNSLNRWLRKGTCLDDKTTRAPATPMLAGSKSSLSAVEDFIIDVDSQELDEGFAKVDKQMDQTSLVACPICGSYQSVDAANAHVNSHFDSPQALLRSLAEFPSVDRGLQSPSSATNPKPLAFESRAKDRISHVDVDSRPAKRPKQRTPLPSPSTFGGSASNLRLDASLEALVATNIEVLDD